MEVFDIKTNNNDFDLEIRNGDFVTGESTQQHQRDLLLAQKGEYRQSPTIGVGIVDYLLGNETEDEFRRNVTKEFEADGMQVRKITVENFAEIKINASYESAESESTR